MADFDPDAYLAKKRAAAATAQPAAPAFDPDAYLAKKNATPTRKTPDVSTGRAALLGFAQGGTANYADEIGGLISKLLIPEGVKANTAPEEGDTPEIAAAKARIAKQQAAVPTSYELARDLMRDETKAADDQHGKMYFASNLGGELSKDAALQIMGVPVTSMPYAVASGALSGSGAADESTLGGKAGGAAMGGAAGLVGGLGGKYVVGPTISKVGGPLVRTMGRKLEDLGIAQGKRALLNGADQLSRHLTPDDAVREALRFGPRGAMTPAILPGGTAKGALKRLEERADLLEAMRSSIVDKLEAAGVKGADARKLADELMEKGSKDFMTSGADKSVAQKYMDEAINVEQLAQEGRLGLKQGEAIKRRLQKEAKYDTVGPQAPMAVAKKDVAASLRRANEAAVEEAGKAAPFGSEVADMAESFVPVKQRLSRTLKAQEAAAKGAQRGSTRGFLGLAGKMAALSGNPQQAALALATGGGMMNRGASTAAAGLYHSGALAQSVGDLLSALSPGAAGLIDSAVGRSILANLLRSKDPVPEPRD